MGGRGRYLGLFTGSVQILPDSQDWARRWSSSQVSLGMAGRLNCLLHHLLSQGAHKQENGLKAGSGTLMWDVRAQAVC